MTAEKLNIRYSLLSKYRAEIMGFAMLSIIVTHAIIWSGATGKLADFSLNLFMSLCYTDAFLFVSGFGLYYSLHKSSAEKGLNRENLAQFYKKRIYRLVIPFVIITLPLFLSTFISTHDLKKFLLCISSLYFWFNGNNGDWYISVSILLYFIVPFIYFLSFRTKSPGYIVGLIMAVFFMAGIVLLKFYPDYYNLIRIGFEKIPIFFLGLYVGYKAVRDEPINKWIIVGLLIFFLLGHAILLKGVQGSGYILMIQQLAGIILLLFLVLYLTRLGVILSPIKWLGTYSLEIYIIHIHLFGVFSKIEFLYNHPILNIVAVIGVSLLMARPVNMLIAWIIRKINSGLKKHIKEA